MLNISDVVQAKVDSMSQQELKDFVYADLYSLYENDEEMLEQTIEELGLKGD